jgi:hypothetical protein
VVDVLRRLLDVWNELVREGMLGCGTRYCKCLSRSWSSGRSERQGGYDLVLFTSGCTIRLFIQRSCVTLGFPVHVCVLQLLKW